MQQAQKPHKWIRQEIESLDPYKDYERIYRLSTSYGLNDFMVNLSYALTFPNFVVIEWGARAIWREDGGKVIERSTHRVEQTTSANALWWFHGPHDPRTQQSVDSINKLHQYWSKKMPGVFTRNEDFIYVCAFTPIFPHRLRLQMGLPGLSEKEKIAGHLFWREMSKLFRVPEGDFPLHSYPRDFDGLIRFCEEYEGRPWPKHERGNLVATAIYEQFVFRFFPPELHWFGHQLLRSLILPTTLETLQIDPPLPMAKEILPKLMGFIFWYQENCVDDPDQSYVEQRENMSAEERDKVKSQIKTLDTAFPAHFIPKYKDDPKFVGCPFHAAMGNIDFEGSNAIPDEVHEREQQAAIIYHD